MLGLGLCVAFLLPLFSWQGVAALEQTLLQRARQSPVLLGPPGSRTDLVLGALFFQGRVQGALTVEDVNALQERVQGTVLPLGLNASAQGRPLVGTEPAYLASRGLVLAEGRRFAVVGEVVAGSETGLGVGDSLRSDVSSLYDVQGSSLVVEVVGVLEPSGGPDDRILLTGMATTWAAQGLLHGHEATDQADPSLFLFDRVDPETLNWTDWPNALDWQKLQALARALIVLWRAERGLDKYRLPDEARADWLPEGANREKLPGRR